MRTLSSFQTGAAPQPPCRDPELKEYRFEVDRRTDNYAQQRGREQVIHDIHNPPLDKIRPISPNNPQLEHFLESAKQIE